MYWLTAVELARQYTDLTYDEWCNLYFNHQKPTEYQLRLCEVTAHAVLVRNNAIEDGVKFINRPVQGVQVKT